MDGQPVRLGEHRHGVRLACDVECLQCVRPPLQVLCPFTGLLGEQLVANPANRTGNESFRSVFDFSILNENQMLFPYCTLTHTSWKLERGCHCPAGSTGSLLRPCSASSACLEAGLLKLAPSPPMPDPPPSSSRTPRTEASFKMQMQDVQFLRKQPRIERCSK